MIGSKDCPVTLPRVKIAHVPTVSPRLTTDLAGASQMCKFIVML
jgi:hypothetical protein